MVQLSWVTYVELSTLAAAGVVGLTYSSIPSELNDYYDILAWMIYIIGESKLNIMIMINMAVCCLFLCGKITQLIFFGTLREAESQHVYDRILNYVLFKIVFIGAILEPGLNELLIWSTWFAILGFMNVFSGLCRDRFEYLMTTANVQVSAHARVIGLLITLLVSDIGWFLLCFYEFGEAGYSVFFLLTFECFTLFLNTVQTLVKYGIHLFRYDSNWQFRGTAVYYTEFVTDSLILLATLAHYCHILFIQGISFNLIDAVLFLNMRIVFNNLREKIASYRNFRKLAVAMNVRYPNVSKEELDALDDDCAICRERMESAKRLPCNHIFHESCLRLWLEQHHSCPTCRYSLIEEGDELARAAQMDANEEDFDEAPPIQLGLNNNLPFVQPPVQQGNGFRAEWNNIFPNFQFRAQRHLVTPEMIHAVQEVFPDVPNHIIEADLATTGSTEATLENILEGRVQIPDPDPHPPPPPPQQQQQQGQQPPPHSPSPNSSLSQNSSPMDINVPVVEAGFAQSPEERARRLAARMEATKQLARKRFLEKQMEKVEREREEVMTATSSSASSSISSPISSPPHSSLHQSNIVDTSSVDSAEETAELRRSKLAEAAERRMRALQNPNNI